MKRYFKSPFPLVLILVALLGIFLVAWANDGLESSPEGETDKIRESDGAGQRKSRLPAYLLPEVSIA